MKFTKPGGHIEVIGELNEQGGITVRVTDTGIGIESEKLGSVFEPFMQIDSALSRQHDGSGLGLSVVKAIMERHNGAVEIRSAVGIGTEVVVLFPPERAVVMEPSQPVDGINKLQQLVITPSAIG